MMKWYIRQVYSDWIVEQIDETPNKRTTGMVVFSIRFHSGFDSSEDTRKLAQEYFDWKTSNG